MTGRAVREEAPEQREMSSDSGARRGAIGEKNRAACAALCEASEGRTPGASGCPDQLTIGCEMSQRLVSFDQVLCIAKLPVFMLTLALAPWPELSHAHSSAFSWPR